MMQNFRDDGEAQIITLAGVIIALTVVLLAVVINTAAISGQKVIRQEVDDAHYVFKNVRDVYGDVLRLVSSNGTANPFKSGTLMSAELNMTKMCNAHGYAVIFEHLYYSDKNTPLVARATTLFSDKDTTYKDTVVYDLTTGDIWSLKPIVWDSGDLELLQKGFKTNTGNDPAYKTYTYFLDIPTDSTIQEINIKVDVTKWGVKGKGEVDTLSARGSDEQIGTGVSTGTAGTHWFNSTTLSTWPIPQTYNDVTIQTSDDDKIRWDIVEVYVKYILP